MDVPGVVVSLRHMTDARGTEQRSFYNPLQKGTAIFLETAEESGGERTHLETDLAPGGGNTPHRHLTYAEHFEVLEGTLTVTVDGSISYLSQGDTAVAPIG